MAGSASVMLIALGGLCALGPIKEEATQPKIVFFLILSILLWISFVTLLTTVLCWTAAKVFR